MKKASEPIRNKIRVDKTRAGHQPGIKKTAGEKLQKLERRSVFQTYLSCADIKKRISEFMKSRLLQADMEQPLLPAKEPCLLIYLNVTSYAALQ